jgi:hypothetical protein
MTTSRPSGDRETLVFFIQLHTDTNLPPVTLQLFGPKPALSRVTAPLRESIQLYYRK